MANNVAPIIEEFRRAYVIIKQEVFDKHTPTVPEYDSTGKYIGTKQPPAVMPMPIITVQARGRKKVDGWYKPSAWNSQAADALNVLAGSGGSHKQVASTDEICIAAEALDKSDEELLLILTHQMVHHYDHHMSCNARGFTRTQNENGYHTTTFKYLAQRFGITATIDGSGGYRTVELDSWTGKEIEKTFKNIALDMSLFDMYRKGVSSTDKKFVGSKLKKWRCGCTNVRVATILHAECASCGERFRYADKDREEQNIKNWLSYANEEAIP